MLSRVAERFYWFGRYVERAENSARLILAYSDMILDLPLRSQADFYQLVEITGSQHEFEALGRKRTETAIMRFLIDEEDNPGSIRSSVQQARENLRTTRDRVPRELSESVNELRGFVLETGPGSIRRGAARSRYLRELIDRCQIVRGYMGGSMSRNDAFNFIRFGRMLERADMTTRIMDVRFDDLLPEDQENLPAFDGIQWMSVLRSLSAYQMYRREVKGRVRGLDVIMFLFLSESFPRSVTHALNASLRCASALPGNDEIRSGLEALIEQVAAVRAGRLARDNAALRRKIDQIQRAIGQVHTQFSLRYFVPDATAQQQQQ